MIKKLAFLSLFLIAIGCSSDDSGTTNSDMVLVKKVTETIYYSGEEQIRISNLTYQNNNLIGINNGNGHELKISYAGDKVTRSQAYENNELHSTSNFTYEGNNLVKIQMDNFGRKAEYTYAEGNLKTISYFGSMNGVDGLLGIETYTFANGNISQMINNNYQWETSISKSTYTYDSGNNPFKNLSLYLRLSLVFEGLNPINTNIAVSSSYYNHPNNNLPSSVYSYVTTYNEANFPIEIKKYDSSNNLITKTAFEYL